MTRPATDAAFVAACKARGVDVEEVALAIAGNFPPLLAHLPWLEAQLVAVFLSGATWAAECGMTPELATRLRAALATARDAEKG